MSSNRCSAPPATLADVNARVRSVDTWFIDRIECCVTAVLNVLRVLVENHFPTTFLPVLGGPGYA